MSQDDDLDVDAAYALQTPEDNKKLYAAWAETYDADFVEAKTYQFPRRVAEEFMRRGGKGPVLDVGAGTGVVAQEIKARTNVVMDAFDLSAEMLAVAGGKKLYRNLIQGDLTRELPLESDTYASIVSSGTFTYGHVGPEALDELLRVAAPSALFVLSIKTELYETAGFKAKFENLSAQVKAFNLESYKVYGQGADPEHAEDTGLVASFLKV